VAPATLVPDRGLTAVRPRGGYLDGGGIGSLMPFGSNATQCYEAIT
jgi:hypothetical protein